MTKPYDKIGKLISQDIIFETKSGSVGLKTNEQGQLIVGAVTAPGTANTLIIDPINNRIHTSEVRFSDGTYIDTAPISSGGGSGGSNIELFNIKANKLFFKYNAEGIAIPNQNIQIKIQKTSNIVGTATFSFYPNPSNNITLTQIEPTTWNLSLSEFEKANSDTLQITANVGTFSDSVSIFKASDGLDALAGGLTNPLVTIPVESDGTLDGSLLSQYLVSAGGQFLIFKGGEELTGNTSKITYSIASATEGLSIFIGSNGIYQITSFDLTEESGEAILVATDNSTGQQFKTRYSVITVRKGATGVTGATGAQGPTGATGAPGSAGVNAKIVKLSVDDAQIAYSASNASPSPTQIQLTASQQNHADGNIFYEFIVYEGGASFGTTLVNSTSNNILLTNTNKNYGSATYTFIADTKTGYGKSKTIKVVTREGTSTSSPISEDSVTIIATKDGSDSLEVVFPNNNHTFPANADGTIDIASYSGGGSIVEAYIGNEQLTPIATGSVVTAGTFRVIVNSNNNIVPGLITTDVSNKRMIIADPSAMSSSNTADITYLISGSDSKGVSKSQLVKASFTKSKKGDAGANGLDALSGLLSNESHAIAASSSGEIFNFSSSPLANAGGTFTVYKGTAIATAVTYSVAGGVVNSGVSGVSQNGLTASINTNSGLYTLSTLNSGSWTSNSETFTFTATSGSTSIDKTYTIVKSLGGVNAKILVLYSDAQVFKKDTNGLYSPINQSIQFTASLNNITTPVTWTVDGLSTGVSSNGAIGTKLNVANSGVTALMSASQFTAATAASTKSFAVVKASTIDSGITYDDTITVQLIQDGAQGAEGIQGVSGVDASNGLLTNESHTIVASSSGEIFNFSNTAFLSAGGEFKFYKGSEELLSDVQYYVLNGTSIAASVVQNGLTASINQSSGIYTLTSSNSNGWSTNAESFTFRAISGSTNVDKNYTIVKSLGGANAKILFLSSNAQIFKKNTNGAYSPTSQTVTFTASLQNLTGTPTWKINGVVANSNQLTINGATATMTQDQFDTARGVNGSVTIKASIIDSTVEYADEITVNLVQDGAQGVQGATGATGPSGLDASTGLLTNESHTIAASSSGEIFNFSANSFTTAGGTFNFYKGTSLLSTGVTYSVSGATSPTTQKIQNGLTASINSSTGVYTIGCSNSTGWTSNSETFTFRAVSGSATIDKAYTIVKSLGGANAKILRLLSNSQTFKKNTSGIYSPASQTVTFTANLQNLTGTPTWQIDSAATGSSLTTVSSNVVTMNQTQFDTVSGSDNSVIIKAFIVDSGITYSDEVTVNIVQDGAQGATGLQGPAGSAGNNARSVDLSATTYQVPYSNANPSTTSVSSITLTASGSNTTGSLTYRFLLDGTQVQAASSTNAFSATGLNIPLAGSTKSYKVEMYEGGVLVATDTISIVGTKDGSDAVTVEIPNNNHTFTCDVSGNVQSFVGSGTTIRVLVGNTALTATAISPPGSGQFRIISTVTNGTIIVPAATVSGDTATIGNLSSFSTDLATVTYTIQFKRLNSTTLETTTVIGTYSKSKVGQTGGAGTDGVDGVDGIDTAKIWDFNQSFQYNSQILVPYGWNITPSSSVDLTAGNIGSNVLAPKFEPSGGYNYPYLSGSGYSGVINNLPLGLTITSSVDSKYGGKLGNFCIQSLSSSIGTNQAYIYSAEAIPIFVGNTYELAYRIKQNTNFLSTQIGLFFFDIEGNLITNIDTDTSIINYAQTSFPYVKDTISSGFQSWSADRVIEYYSFETGGVLKTFPSTAKYVKPYIRMEFITGGSQGVTFIRQLLIDYLYFGEKTTPNSRNGIFIDNITGKITVGAALADVAGSAGGLTESKYDPSANFEIITGSVSGSEIVDLKLTRAYQGGYVNSASNGSNLAIGKDIAALRFAGWNGVFAGANNTTNMLIDERAEIRATYMRTGSRDANYGALGGASLDFYTSPSRTSVGFNNVAANTVRLRARITDQGQFLIGYNDAATQVNPNISIFTAPWPSTSQFTFNSTNTPAKLAINGNIYANGSLIIENNSRNLIQGTTYIEGLEPTTTGINIGANNPFDTIKCGKIELTTGRENSSFASITPDSFNINSYNNGSYFGRLIYHADAGYFELDNGYFIVNQQVLNNTSTADGGNDSTNGGITYIDNSGNHYWRHFINNNGDFCFNYTTPPVLKGYIDNGTVRDAKLNFTGQHRNIPENIDENFINKIGLIVVSCGNYSSEYSNSITINESLPKVKLSSKRNEKSVFGVISDKEEPNSTKREYSAGNFISVYEKETNDDRLIINSLGEGGIWVSNINGNLENGDYITTCEIPGYGMKQDDDLLHNYTVAKITCDCNFDLESPIYICEQFEFEGKTYRRAFVGCTYHCG